jgi:hypothetical protein
VVPFDAVPVQPVDCRLAWTAALEAANFFQLDVRPLSGLVPPDWADLVAGQEPALAVPFCIGNYPQMVRQFLPLLRESKLGSFRTDPDHQPGVSTSSLDEWVDETARQGRFPQILLALGALRLARAYDRADVIMNQFRERVPGSMVDAWANEEAALFWHRGQAEPARARWLAQQESVPVTFNRGVAALFSDRPKEARASLRRAVDQLPETTSWYHLGSLYLAVAEMRE